MGTTPSIVVIVMMLKNELVTIIGGVVLNILSLDDIFSIAESKYKEHVIYSRIAFDTKREV